VTNLFTANIVCRCSRPSLSCAHRIGAFRL